MRADQPSLTALGVAIARSTLPRPSSPTGAADADDALAASLLEGVPERRRAEEQAASPEARDFFGFLAARTVFFDEAVLRALAGGVTQIVILGAGYDGRALRFRSPGVRFFEVDHPATQADKRARLEQLAVPHDDITFVEADFTEERLDGALGAAGHDPGVASLFVCEGVLRYLPERSFRGLLATVASRAARQSELAVSISTRPATETREEVAARDRHAEQLARSGEPVLTVPPRAVALRWLADAGWTAGEVTEVEPGRPGRLLVLAHPT